ncbi:glycoside hydrolase family 127 protein [Flavobacteriaceae bacterium XHP0103]|uniref:glycoside hydrolase family 127 protein n=1 Tax=Marixanthotalea marina TaxID=2844359 RepID=UPI002989BA75|nr:glycoside hydrolase family 127 protein [Marixanthotalea marina]MBU3821420.1 glycoside hydrolase family 127 protein [Marixanthotalea marina]
MKKILFAFFISYSALAQMQPFTLQEVRITEGPFKNAQDVDMQYILELEPDRLLAPYLIDAGFPTKQDRYGNWESIGLDGHIAGHYLSALAMLYASTDEPELKSRLDYMLSELERCQNKNGNGYVGGIPQGKIFWERIHKGDIDGSGFGLNNTWVPLYNIHKLFAGLYDAYYYTGSEQAKNILVKLGDWFVELIAPLSDEQIQSILRTEHGGIAESFADLYTLTGKDIYLQTAKKLTHKNFFEPLLNKEDKLTGMHANTQIPKVIGYEKVAELTDNKDWNEAVKLFWHNIVDTRSVAFGGNSVAEHFNPVDDFSSMVKSNQGPESCNSYNMLRLTKELYFNNNDVSYLDFYERTLYNHILSTQHPEKGGFVYFTPIRPNHYRVYSQPSTSMWCCVGSGLENHTKYGELIYSHNENDVFMNLFIPSTLNWEEKGIQLTQNTKFPYEDQSEIVLNLKKKKAFAINIRQPKWAGYFEVLVNGKVQNIQAKSSSYATISRTWKSGDKILVRFKTSTRLENLPDDSNWVAYVNGPIVLAAKTSTEDLDGLFADDSRMGHAAHGKMIPLDEAYALVGDKDSYLSKAKEIGNLRFRLDSLELQPFFEVHDARYQMYFQTYSPQEYIEKQELLKQQEMEALALEAITIDKVSCGEQQVEVGHNYEGEKSNSGYDEGKFWRNTRAYISYQLSNNNLEGKFLDITVLDELKLDNVEITVNNKPAEIISAENKTIKIGVTDKEVVKVKITSTNERPTPRFYELRIIKE